LAQIKDAPAPAVTVAVLQLRLRTEDGYRQSLKTFLFAQYWCVQRIRGFYENVLYKSTLDIWHAATMTGAFVAVIVSK